MNERFRAVSALFVLYAVGKKKKKKKKPFLKNKNVIFSLFFRDCFMTDDSQWRMVVRESGGSVFTTTTRPTTTLFCCYDDETTFPGENGCTAVPSNRRPSSGHPDTIRPRARFPFAKGSDSAYRTRESHTEHFLLTSAVSTFHGRPFFSFDLLTIRRPWRHAK